MSYTLLCWKYVVCRETTLNVSCRETTLNVLCRETTLNVSCRETTLIVSCRETTLNVSCLGTTFNVSHMKNDSCLEITLNSRSGHSMSTMSGDNTQCLRHIIVNSVVTIV